MNKVLFISIKPEFAEKIFNGSKTIELRKYMPNISEGDLVVVYSTSPEKAVVGICKLKGIIKTTPEKLWVSYSDKLGIEYSKFREYFKDSKFAIGLQLTSISRLERKISLEIIKKYYPSFTPPQTYRYFDKNEVKRGYRRTFHKVSA